MFESHAETYIDWTSFNFRFKDFLNNLLLKIIISCVTDKNLFTVLLTNHQ